MNKKLGVLFGVVFLGLVPASPAMAGWSQRQKITSTPRGVGAQFGHAVAISGNPMVVGAQFDATTAPQAGAAYVFVLSGGTWTQQATLLANDGAITDKFGVSVAISGDTIIVGAFNANAPLSNGGAAYVYTRNGTTWTHQQKLTAADGTADDQFGNAVAIDGNVVVVGANHADLPSAAQAGAAYIFLRSGTVWTQTQRLSPQFGVLLGDIFGDSVTIGVNGQRILIGATGDDTPQTAAGAVYVFVDSGLSNYTLEQKLTIADGSNGDQFGFSVALDGNTLVGGATEDAPVGQSALGCAYVFAFNGSSWLLQQKLVASDALSFDRFGYSVAVLGQTVAVGARTDDTTVGPDAGSAYIFTRTGTVWTEKQKIGPTDSFNGDRFGVSMDFSANGLLAIGAAEKPLSSPNGQGAVYTFGQILPPVDFDSDGKTDRTIFRPSAGVWYSLLSATSTAAATAWGVSTDIDVAADYDGDGKADIAVWRPSTGQWFILQSATSTVRVDGWGVSGDIPLAGDVDGDGKADLVIWRPSSGTWYAKQSTGGILITNWGVNGDQPLLGDFDADGKADFTIYRPAASGGWYVSLSGGGFQTIAWGVATDIPVAGDWDGDGKADAGIFRPSTGQWFIKQSSGAILSVNWGTTGDIPLSGDHDGDGKSDFIIWRSSNGVWYTQFATGGAAAVGWGVAGDRPIGRAPGS